MIDDINSAAFDTRILKIITLIIFFHSRHDAVLTGVILKRYFSALLTPMGKALIYLENSGHFYCEVDIVAAEKIMIQASRKRETK
jgi:hypothetical protein